MTVPTIFETCRPREDVLAGVTDADFAADLAQVVTTTGSREYHDPVRFFANTYPTRGLKNLLGNVCRRLSGAGGDMASIFRLDTSYGGGKTHGLIALAHAAGGLKGVATPPAPPTDRAPGHQCNRELGKEEKARYAFFGGIYNQPSRKVLGQLVEEL